MQDALRDTATVEAHHHGQYAARARDAGAFKAYVDVHGLVAIDLDTANGTQVRMAAGPVWSAATTESRPGCRIGHRSDGRPFG